MEDYAAAKAIYGPIYPEIEKLYLEALAKTAEGSPQRARLEMFGDNMVEAHFHAWKAKLLPDADAKASPLFKGTDDLEEFMVEKSKGISTISVTNYLRIYRNYTDMPVLRPGWRPR